MCSKSLKNGNFWGIESLKMAIFGDFGLQKLYYSVIILEDQDGVKWLNGDDEQI